jgi:hypothetical protein
MTLPPSFISSSCPADSRPILSTLPDGQRTVTLVNLLCRAQSKMHPWSLADSKLELARTSAV